VFHPPIGSTPVGRRVSGHYFDVEASNGGRRMAVVARGSF